MPSGDIVMRPCYRYLAELDRVVDGDTLDVLIDLGFYIRIKERIRLEGVDTPELGTITQCRMQIEECKIKAIYQNGY